MLMHWKLNPFSLMRMAPLGIGGLHGVDTVRNILVGFLFLLPQETIIPFASWGFVVDTS